MNVQRTLTQEKCGHAKLLSKRQFTCQISQSVIHFLALTSYLPPLGCKNYNPNLHHTESQSSQWWRPRPVLIHMTCSPLVHPVWYSATIKLRFGVYPCVDFFILSYLFFVVQLLYYCRLPCTRVVLGQTDFNQLASQPAKHGSLIILPCLACIQTVTPISMAGCSDFLLTFLSSLWILSPYVSEGEHFSAKFV